MRTNQGLGPARPRPRPALKGVLVKRGYRSTGARPNAGSMALREPVRRHHACNRKRSVTGDRYAAGRVAAPNECRAHRDRAAAFRLYFAGRHQAHGSGRRLPAAGAPPLAAGCAERRARTTPHVRHRLVTERHRRSRRSGVSWPSNCSRGCRGLVREGLGRDRCAVRSRFAGTCTGLVSPVGTDRRRTGRTGPRTPSRRCR